MRLLVVFDPAAAHRARYMSTVVRPLNNSAIYGLESQTYTDVNIVVIQIVVTIIKTDFEVA